MILDEDTLSMTLMCGNAEITSRAITKEPARNFSKHAAGVKLGQT
jgi:hypothetical protein